MNIDNVFTGNPRRDQVYRNIYFSCDNKYVPIYVTKLNSGIFNGKIVKYGIPIIRRMVLYKSYPKLLEMFKRASSPKLFRTRTMMFSFIVTKGIICDRRTYKPLVCLTVKTEYLKRFAKGERVPKSAYKLWLDVDLLTNAEYRTFHSKLVKMLVTPLLTCGYKVEYSPSLSENLFKMPKVDFIPNFETLDEHVEYMDSFNQEILTND